MTKIRTTIKFLKKKLWKPEALSLRMSMSDNYRIQSLIKRKLPEISLDGNPWIAQYRYHGGSLEFFQLDSKLEKVYHGYPTEIYYLHITLVNFLPETEWSEECQDWVPHLGGGHCSKLNPWFLPEVIRLATPREIKRLEEVFNVN